MATEQPRQHGTARDGTEDGAEEAVEDAIEFFSPDEEPPSDEELVRYPPDGYKRASRDGLPEESRGDDRT